MEPIEEWLEEEMQRNGMDKKVKVGAADVTFKSDHHVFDAELPRDVQSEDELYGAPTRKLSPEEGNYYVPKGRNAETRAAEQTMAQVVNILSTIDNLEAGPEVTNARDMVVLPHHYARFAIEPIRFAVENNLNFLQANIVKYILRFDAKNGMEDLKKAERYLLMLQRWVAKDPDWWKP